MFMILLHHAVVHSGSLNIGPSYPNYWISLALVPAGKVAFDAFIAISCWFLADAKFKCERFIKTYAEVLFYSVLTTVAAFLLGSELSVFEWIGCFLPITGAVQGYAQTYLAFYLLIPFLSRVSAGMTKFQNKILIGILFTFVFVFRVMSRLFWNEQSVYSRLTLFIFFYFLFTYIKRNPIKLLDNVWFCLGVFLLGYGSLVGINYGSVLLPDFVGWKYLSILAPDEGGLLNIISGISLFLVFKNINIRTNKIINLCAGSSFAVLLIHDGHFFRSWTWTISHISEWFFSPWYPVRLIVTAVIIYAICMCVDIIRKYTVEHFLVSNARISQFCSRINEKLNFDSHEHSC